MKLTNSAQPDTACRFSSGCTIPAGDPSVTLRARELNGDLSTLISFDQGGITCVQDKVDDEGEDWFAAGWACKSSSSPEVVVYWIG